RAVLLVPRFHSVKVVRLMRNGAGEFTMKLAALGRRVTTG
ncbi:MAG: hypothetical protein ACI9OJ_004483, partial [Myxococcota bacterium]